MKTLKILGVTIKASESGLYSLTGLFKSSGAESKNRPQYWLKRKDTGELIEHLKCELFNSIASIDGKPAFLSNQQLISENVISIAIGSSEFDGGTFVCKELVYDYAMWISKSFMVAVIRAFWLKRQDTKELVSVLEREKSDVGFLTLEQNQKVIDVKSASPENGVGNGLLTKKTYGCGQSKYFVTGKPDWAVGGLYAVKPLYCATAF